MMLVKLSYAACARSSSSASRTKAASSQLADPLPAETELLADRLERGGFAVEAEAKLEHPALALGKRDQSAANLLTLQGRCRLFGRIAGVGVAEELAELAIVL